MCMQVPADGGAVPHSRLHARMGEASQPHTGNYTRYTFVCAKCMGIRHNYTRYTFVTLNLTLTLTLTGNYTRYTFVAAAAGGTTGKPTLHPMYSVHARPPPFHVLRSRWPPQQEGRQAT